MKNTKALFFMTLLLCAVFTSFKPTGRLHSRQPIDTSKIAITIKLVNGRSILNKDSITVELQIDNISGTTIRLPDIFTNLKTNTYLSIAQEAGRSIIPIEMAFADYSTGSMPGYLSIAKGKSYKKTIALSELLKSRSKTVTGGTYKLEASYINTKGTDCIKGTFYSNTITFEVKKDPELITAPEATKPFAPLTKSTNPTGKFTDKRDGQVYTCVKIGKQTWMSQNLNYKSKIGCSFYPDGDTTNAHHYGLYYDFAALKDVCPQGWHVPTDQEWQQLEINGGRPGYQNRLERRRHITIFAWW